MPETASPSPAAPQDPMQVAIALCRAQRWGDAERVVRAILARQPQHDGALHLLAVLALRVGQHQPGAELAARAIEANPRVATYHRTCAVARKLLGQRAEALALWQQAATLEPNNAQWQLELGLALHDAGDIERAEACYRQALALKADYAEAMANLGTLMSGKGCPEEAVALCRRATELRPNLADAHNTLGSALQKLGKLDEAVASLRRALQLAPNYAEANCNLGCALFEQGATEEAVGFLRRAVELKPSLPGVHRNFAVALAKLDRCDEAIVHYREALRLQPDNTDLLCDLTTMLLRRGLLDEAVTTCRRVLELKPDHGDAHRQLGVALHRQGQLADAIAALERAIALQADDETAWHELAVAFHKKNLHVRAEAACREALRLEPDFAEAHRTLSSIIGEVGRMDEAITAAERAVALKPDDASLHGNLLFLLNFSAAHDATAIFAEHRRYDERHGKPLTAAAPAHTNDRDPRRKLRIGYVSHDFRLHSLAFFLEPILASHDRNKFSVVCYSGAQQTDGITRRFEQMVDLWRPIAGLNNDEAAARIREDGIDILVDLALHSDTRMPLFARKPAPVQVSYLGYAGTTGLSAMDYKLTDALLDPRGYEAHNSEQLFRLPGYFCYRMIVTAPEVTPVPARASGEIAFGSFQNLAKISPQTVALWSRVLAAVPHSRLVVKARGLGDESARRRLAEMFAQHGLDGKRLRIEDSGSMAEYLAALQQLDIALDTTPYNGGTTTCHTLWMGVPVVSLAGERAVSRMGLSILSSLGLRDLVADSPDGFVETAARLANDFSRLEALRVSLRDRMAHSPLTDGAQFTRQLEAAYRTMWQTWCRQSAAPTA